MNVVLPFWSGDVEQAKALLLWAIELDGKVPNTGVLVFDDKTDGTEVAKLAVQYFKDVIQLRIDSPPDRTWPRPQNHYFQRTAFQYSLKSTLNQTEWLWWETDAWPLTKGWLATIETMYRGAKKPFMGPIVRPQGYTAGVSVYPGKVTDFFTDAMLVKTAPWDIVSQKDVRGKVHDASAIMQHEKNGDKFRSPADLQRIRPGAVLYHKVKDTSLADLLRSQMGLPPATETPPELVAVGSHGWVQLPAVTVVLTNWKRPEFLWKAFESCRGAGVQRLVVTSSSVDSEVKKVQARILDAMPSVEIVSEDGDSGCNQNWLRGIKETRTSHVTILHDDDLILSDFSQIERHIQGNHGFVLWNVRRHGMNFNDTYPPLSLSEGVYPSPILYQNLLHREGYTLSPVSGCFKRADLIRTLEECQSNFGPEFYLKPTMMIGNDLLIWLRAIQRNRTFKYVPTPLTSYGHHSGSTTCDEVFNGRGKLGPIYAAARKYFLKDAQRIVHVVSKYDPKDADTVRRHQVAEKSWNEAYKNELLEMNWVLDVPRDSSSVGCEPGFPFLKDVLKQCPGTWKENDIVMLTNADTVFHPSLYWRLFDFMQDHPCATAFRAEFRGTPPDASTPFERLKDILTDSPGRDLFAFRPSWLRENWDNIPDYLLGHTDWDSTLAVLMRISQGIHVTECDWIKPNPETTLPTGVIMHESHAAPWAVARMDRAANRYNRELTKTWIKKNGLGWYL